MTATYQAWADSVRKLAGALAALEAEAAALGEPSPAGCEWCQLLRGKLLPQLQAPPVLVVGVVGGTNIGKSVVFNHLAGENASASSPLAAGTKHPVCLVPPPFDNPELLGVLFEQFAVRRWQSAQDPLGESGEHLLFFRPGARLPDRLVLIDAPDVDSDATVNWHRARAIRQSADVLIAILTQQKYNDAAVKQFFREAATADKPIIVCFNQVDLELDRDYWPLWLDTFCQQTGARPDLVYVLPHNRTAADSLTLPFYEVGPDGRRPPGEPADLGRELAALQFDAIKLRTFRGAMRRLTDPEQGIPAYLGRIRFRAANYLGAAQALSAADMARVAWPSLPPRVLVDEIRAWWDDQRSHFSRNIHGAYRALGRGITWPVRAAWQSLHPGEEDPREAFRARERDAVVRAVEKLLDELHRLADVGNEILRPRLLHLLGGGLREDLLARVQAAHAELPPVDDDYRAFLRGRLDAWSRENPRAVTLLRSADYAMAVARPAITIALAVSGWMVGGDLVGHAASVAIQHTATHLATEAAIAGGTTVGGEAVVATTTEGVRHAAARLFGQLQDHYAQQRATWLARWLETELLGDLLADLRRGAEVPQSHQYAEVAALLETIRSA